MGRTKGHGIVEKIWAKIPSSCEKTLVDMCEDVQLWRLREVTVEEFIDQKFPICADVLKTRCTQRDVVKKHCTTENIQVCKNEEMEEESEDEEKKALELGRGNRSRKETNYDDQLS